MGENPAQRDPSTGRFYRGNTVAAGYGRRKAMPDAIGLICDELVRQRKYRQDDGSMDTVVPLEKMARDFVTKLMDGDRVTVAQLLDRLWPTSQRIELTGEDGDDIRISDSRAQVADRLARVLTVPAGTDDSGAPRPSTNGSSE